METTNSSFKEKKLISNLNATKCDYLVREMTSQIVNWYSCQHCGCLFESPETDIVPNLYPVCSSSCKFRILYFWINLLSNDETLSLMHQIVLKNPKNYEFKRNQALFDITKRYAKHNLSSIKILLSLSLSKKLYHDKATLYHFITLSPPLYDKGGCDKDKVGKFDKGGLIK